MATHKTANPSPQAKPAVPSIPKPAPPESLPPLQAALRLATRFQRFAWDFSGVLTLAFALMSLLALLRLPQLTGSGLLGFWGDLLRRLFGYVSVLIPLVIGIAGLLMLRRSWDLSQVSWRRVFSLEAAAFSAMILTSLIGGSSLRNAESGLDAGTIGWGLAELLRIGFHSARLEGDFWLYLVDVPVLIFSLIVGLNLGGFINSLTRKLFYRGPAFPVEVPGTGPTISMAPLSDQAATLATNPEARKKQPTLPPEYRKKFRIPSINEKSAPPPPRDERLPPLELLVNEQSSRPDERNINLTAGLIEKTLAEFGIPAKVIGFRVGPTVTQFALEPGFLDKSATGDEEARQKVRVSQIASLAKDLALSLSAERLRIEAPVPGRPYIGIEVPNTRSTVVRLRPILENEAFYRFNSPLAIAIGRDVSGQPVVADLEGMPHLLIAGTTGSGKSVCIAALTTCLVMNNTPEDLRFVMIDPKMVELVRFNGLPHLLGKVETDLERILGVLHWTVAEMDRRYKLLEEMHARHLDSYNRKIRRRKGGEVLPRIVVMIDELADLMMTSPDQTEPALIRLAQLSRATGIHLVVATQRPSTDVVTGLIKANFPARISFAVASSIDSRVILDSGGAESLLGRGDMLFNPPDASAPIRAQGVMVSDQEVERMITFWQRFHEEEITPPPWEELLAQAEVALDRDNLINKAVEIVRESQHCSASLLQRRLRIGYPRAARLVDELEAMGVIGPSQGGGREREVFIAKDEEIGDSRKNMDTDYDEEDI